MASPLRTAIPALGSLLLHALVAAFMGRASIERQVSQKPIEVAVVDAPRPPEPKPPEPEAPKPKPRPVPMKLTRAPKQLEPLPVPRLRPPVDLPPPPTTEAKTDEPPVVLPGITMESTATSGSFAVPTGNTLYGDPGRKGRDPATVHPYKAERYASSAQITEMPSPAFGALNLRKYYPTEAAQKGFEADVVLRLLIDSDGSVAKAELVTDPGEGLGPAALKAVHELHFNPGKVNGEAVATTVPFTLHFKLD